ncbi:MAG: hypothetical protein ABIQ31_05010 [Ferruginibacter sp.]
MDAARFRIIFRSTKGNPFAYKNIKAYQRVNDIMVEWKVKNDFGNKSYVVEKSTDGINFDEAGEIVRGANSGDRVAYSWPDKNINWVAIFIALKTLRPKELQVTAKW